MVKNHIIKHSFQIMKMKLHPFWYISKSQSCYGLELINFEVFYPVLTMHDKNNMAQNLLELLSEDIRYIGNRIR